MLQTIKNISEGLQVDTTHKACTNCAAQYGSIKHCYVCNDTRKELTKEGVELAKLYKKLEEHFNKEPYTGIYGIKK